MPEFIDDAPPVSHEEETAVRAVLTAGAASVRSGLEQSSKGDRVFMLVTAPSGRRGRIHIATDLAGDELTAFLAHVMKHVNSPELQNIGHPPTGKPK